MSFNDDPFTAGLPQEGEDSMADVLGGFPRHLTTQLIEEGAERESWRQQLGVWALAVALTLFALALPAARTDLATAYAGSLGGPVLGGWPAGLNGLMPGLVLSLGAHGAEQVLLLLSALAYGLCVPVAFAITRPFGASFGLRLAAVLVVLLGAAPWLAGTSAMGGSVLLLFALELCRRTWSAPAGLRWRALVGLVLYALVFPILAWLLPAVLVAGLDGEGDSGARRRRALLGGGLALAALALGWFVQHANLGSPGSAALLSSLQLSPWSGALAGSPWYAIAAWSAATLGVLGVSFAGLAALPLLRRGESEERPPRWLYVWCALPLAVALLAPGALYGMTSLLLLPVALIGILDLLARQDEAPGRGLALLLVGAQVAGLAGALAYFRANDPLGPWREEAIQILEPSDLVISADPVHRELLVRRWDLDVTAARPYGLTPGVETAVERAWAAGRRVAVDAGSFREGVGASLAAALAERGAVVVLAANAPVTDAPAGGSAGAGSSE